eukprot:9202528-Pyramimonas_sp.AAC.1
MSFTSRPRRPQRVEELTSPHLRLRTTAIQPQVGSAANPSPPWPRSFSSPRDARPWDPPGA